MDEAHRALRAMGLLNDLKQEAGTEAAMVQAVNLLLTIANNVVTKGDDKFRSIKCGNKAFLAKVGLLPSGVELIQALGFVKKDACYVLEAPGVPCQGVMRALREAVSSETIREYDTAVTSSPVPAIALRDGDFTESDYETLLTLDAHTTRCSPQSVITSLQTTTASAPSTCYVCLEPLQTGDPCTKLACNDTFHPYCIKRWAQESCYCPICKSDLAP
eukprot:TRINITY_DN4800_c0_g1_i4.p1 TRINITY_DN4800_c0_g1~~TRINITY_DN4800_c0_g1_i4.p1  ORF type:complete len:234 (+),score=49.41 TRINITY_DN4800_c0_g1_i4:54-704(+)